MLNFQDLTHKTDFGTSGGRTVLHLPKKPVGNQYLKVVRILVTPQNLVPLEISAQFERHSLCSTEDFFQHPYIKKVFPFMIQS